jgi:hypothetical protein
MLRRIAEFSIVFAISAQLVLPQVDAWERVKRVETGKQVSITLQSGKSVSGKMSEWRADGVSLQRGKRIESLAKADITKVYVTAGMSRGKRAAWAAGIGGAAGAGTFGALVAGGDTAYVPPGAIVAVGALFISGTAAGIAALIPQRKQLVYQAPGASTK